VFATFLPIFFPHCCLLLFADIVELKKSDKSVVLAFTAEVRLLKSVMHVEVVPSLHKNCLENDLTFVLCCLQEAAEFACYADLQDEQDIACHFSLKLPMYVQFTSPIRRYMDLVIHRFVAAALDNESTPYTLEEVGVMSRFIILYFLRDNFH